MRRSTRTLCFGAAALLVLAAGTGLADDADTAKLRLAAEQGNALAQYRLGSLIEPGLTIGALTSGPPASARCRSGSLCGSREMVSACGRVRASRAPNALSAGCISAATALSRTSASPPGGTTGLRCKGTVMPSTGLASCTRRTVRCRTIHRGRVVVSAGGRTRAHGGAVAARSVVPGRQGRAAGLRCRVPMDPSCGARQLRAVGHRPAVVTMRRLCGAR